MTRQPITTDLIKTNLEGTSFNEVAKGIHDLHNTYHQLQHIDLFGRDVYRSSRISKDLEEAARSGEFDSLLINLLSFPARGISFEAGHDLCHSPTGLRTLAAFWKIGDAELAELIKQKGGAIGALHEIQNITFECAPQAERALESIFPHHKERKGGNHAEALSDLATRLKQIVKLWVEAPEGTDIFCNLLLERIGFFENITVSRFNAEAVNLIIESLHADNSDTFQHGVPIISPELARRMLIGLPKLNRIAFGERNGTIARSYGHDLVIHIMKDSKKKYN